MIAKRERVLIDQQSNIKFNNNYELLVPFLLCIFLLVRGLRDLLHVLLRRPAQKALTSVIHAE